MIHLLTQLPAKGDTITLSRHARTPEPYSATECLILRLACVRGRSTSSGPETHESLTMHREVGGGGFCTRSEPMSETHQEKEERKESGCRECRKR